MTLGPQVTAGGALTFDGGEGPQPLDAGVAVTSPSTGLLSSATVSIGSGFVSGDMLNFVNTADITGSYDAVHGVLTLTGNDTRADYQTALDSITYSFSPTDGDPTNGSRTIDWKVSDGTVASNTATSSVTTLHEPPAVTAGATITYETGSSGVNLDAGAAVTDPDSGGKLTGATVSIATGFDSAHDTLTIGGNASGTINSIHYSISGATVTLTGTDTLADYQAVLDSITFSTTATVAGSRTVDWTVTDGVASSARATSTVSVALGPQVAAGATVIYDGGGTPATLDGGLTLTDPFSTTLTGATATIGSAIAGDTLTINGTTSGIIHDGSNGTIGYTFANGIMTLTGADTVADYQAALQSIAYSNSGDLTAGGHRPFPHRELCDHRRQRDHQPGRHQHGRDLCAAGAERRRRHRELHPGRGGGDARQQFCGHGSERADVVVGRHRDDRHRLRRRRHAELQRRARHHRRLQTRQPAC